MVFNFVPVDSDPTVQAVAGLVVKVRELGDGERDPEVGPMFEVRNLNNARTAHAFEDELREV